MKRRARQSLAGGVLAALLWVVPGAPLEAACSLVEPVAIQHFASGYFQIDERAGAQFGPRVRFWQYGSFRSANSAAGEQYNPDMEWLREPGAKGVAGFAPGQFQLYQANWASQGVVGCPPKNSRTVVEISHVYNEGSTSHYTYYLVASVARTVGGFNFDDVAPSQIRAEPIPVPRPGSVEPSSRQGYLEVVLTLPDARSYGDAQKPGSLIAGYNVLYLNDTEPTSSSPGAYRPALDPSNPSAPAAMVPYGAGSARVAIPRPERAAYFATLLVYADPARPVSNGTSGHSNPVHPPAGSENEEGSGEAEEEPTPPPDEPDVEEREAAREAEPKPTPRPTAGPRDRPDPRESTSSSTERGSGDTPPTEAPVEAAGGDTSAGSGGGEAVSVSLPGGAARRPERPAARTTPRTDGGLVDLPPRSETREPEETERAILPVPATGGAAEGEPSPEESAEEGSPGAGETAAGGVPGETAPAPVTHSASTATGTATGGTADAPTTSAGGDGEPGTGTDGSPSVPDAESTAAGTGPDGATSPEAGATSQEGGSPDAQRDPPVAPASDSAPAAMSPWRLADAVLLASIIALGLAVLVGRRG